MITVTYAYIRVYTRIKTRINTRINTRIGITNKRAYIDTRIKYDNTCINAYLKKNNNTRIQIIRVLPKKYAYQNDTRIIKEHTRIYAYRIRVSELLIKGPVLIRVLIYDNTRIKIIRVLPKKYAYQNGMRIY